MGWKAVAKQRDNHNTTRTPNQEWTDLPDQEERPRNINKRRNALTISTLRDDILRILETPYSTENQQTRQWREN